MKRTKAVRILLVDDEPDILATLEMLLRREGYRVATAGNGKEALETFRTDQFDLVVSDIRMPEMDGLELMKALRPQNSRVEFIFLTGFASLDTAVDALRDNGAFDYLTKPLDSPDVILRSIERALERQRLRENNAALTRELTERNIALEAALKEIKTLKGILPVCAACKKVRDDKGIWNRLEAYIQTHTDALISHSICPDCSREYYGDLSPGDTTPGDTASGDMPPDDSSPAS
ncbi:MAG: response regulator [Desulfobacterales bacterium]|nr:response regulator [Desulfobacterales bacterium]